MSNTKKEKLILKPGTKIGHLTAVERTNKRKGTNVVWLFQCDCGNMVEKATGHLNEESSCGDCVYSARRKDITGMKFGLLTALYPLEQRNTAGEIQWVCRCDCGNTIVATVGRLTSGNTKSCGCYLKLENKVKLQGAEVDNRFNIIGNRYGLLTVIDVIDSNNSRGIKWKCQCDCGNEVTATTLSLTHGKKRSCGCVDAKRHCVFKHVSPDGLVYIGSTSQTPATSWKTGEKYRHQYVFNKAIEEIGGFDSFMILFDHFILKPDGEWIVFQDGMTYDETNFFTRDEANKLKKHYIKEYRSNEPDFGYNSTTGGDKHYTYTDEVKQRSSKTKTGADGRTDWKVYKHTNRINGKVYIGKTCMDPKQRWSGGSGYKDKRGQGIAYGHFYNAIQKYGWDNFDHEIVAEGMTNKEASEMEIRLIEEYESTNPDKGYNTTKGGEGAAGYRHSEETKQHLSEIKKGLNVGPGNPFYGRHHSEETKALIGSKAKERLKGKHGTFYGRHHSLETKQKLREISEKPITQYDLDGKKVTQYESLMIAAEEIGTSVSSISACANKRTRTCKGFIWRYEDVEQLPTNEMPIMAHGGGRKVLKCGIQGNVIEEYGSVIIAAEKNQLNKYEIYDAVHHKHGKQQAGGFVWKYKDSSQSNIRNGKVVFQYDQYMNLLNTFLSVKEASQKTGISTKSISSAARGHTNTAGGFIWKDEDSTG